MRSRTRFSAGDRAIAPKARGAIVERLEDRRLLSAAPTVGLIAGRIWEDRDGSARFHPGVAMMAGWTVLLDRNNNGRLDPGERLVSTDAAGQYAFGHLPPGAYNVRYLAPGSNYLPSAGQTDHVTLTVSPGIGTIWYFGVRSVSGVIAGTLSDPAAANQPLRQWGVYLDLNHNGHVDLGEPWTITNAAGSFQFTNVQPGTYDVRVDPSQRGWSPDSPADSGSVVVLGGRQASANLSFHFHADPPPASYSLSQLVDWYLIGGTSINARTRTIGYNLDRIGWEGFVRAYVLPDIQWGVRRIGLHTPFGAVSGETYLEADQYLQAQAVGFTWLTANFVQAWQPITAKGVEVIAYIGNPMNTASFQSLASAGNVAGWMARFNASVAPLVASGMSIAIDGSAGVSQNSLLWTAIQSLRAKGTRVYLEIRPSEYTPYLWNFPTVADDRSWLDSNPYQSALNPVVYYNAKNSELPAGNAVRVIFAPTPGHNWNNVQWLPAYIQSILRAGDTAGIPVGMLRAHGITLKQILTPMV